MGRAGLHRPEVADWPGVEVGWVLHPQWLGQGVRHRSRRPLARLRVRGDGADEVFSVILPENIRSQAVARRLGLTLVEERVLSHYPAEPHGIWRLCSWDLHWPGR